LIALIKQCPSHGAECAGQNPTKNQKSKLISPLTW